MFQVFMNNKMGPLTLQIMILVASFLFYRILRSGFDSWKAILIDFGIVIFLFGLQYYLQKKQEKTNIENIFPAGPLSTFFGANFPPKIATPFLTKTDNVSIRPEYGCYLQLSNDIFIEPMKRKTLYFNDKLSRKDIWKNNQFQIQQNGFYIIQLTLDTDIVPYASKLSIVGKKNQIDKSIHDGENSFIIYLNAEDKVQFEIENPKSDIMIHDTTTLYIIKL